MMSDPQNIGFQIRFHILGQRGSFRIFLGVARQQDRTVSITQAKDQRIVVLGG